MSKPMICLVMGVLLAGSTAWGLQDPTESIERTMTFIDKSGEATELFLSGKTEEALAAFQDLLANCRDLDQDGYVAIAVGDCLMALNRTAEAEAAYKAAAQDHPDVQEQVDQRLVELAITGDVTDDLLARLRYAVQTAASTDFMPTWRLGRALQRRARALLVESLAAFRKAAEIKSPMCEGLNISNHVTELEELADDLGSLIDHQDVMWGRPGASGFYKRLMEECQGPKIVMQKQEARWQVKLNGKSPVAVQLNTDEKGIRQFRVDGRPVTLDINQTLLLQRHQQRINEILLQAAGKIDNVTGK
jgi:tetratricopeptide (TPR) repeat protein